MRLIFTTSLILLFAFTSLAQSPKNHPAEKLIGVWQVSSPQMGDAWLSNYRFYSNGVFKYTSSQYDDQRTLIDIVGTYKFKVDTLTLIIKLRHEIAGGDIVMGSMGFQKEELTLEGGNLIEIKQKNKEPMKFALKFFVKKGAKCFTIQNNTYYLIYRNPTIEDN